MNNIENNKIDLERKILKEIKSRTGAMDPSYESLVRYFIELDLISTLGKTEFDDEIDIVSTKASKALNNQDGMYITTIFDSNYKINYSKDGSVEAYRINKKEDGELDLDKPERIFSLTLGPEVVTNTVVTPKGIVGPEFSTNESFEIESTYEVNIPDKAFKYSCGEKGKEVSYKACLSGLNAKFSSHEMMSYDREIPPVGQEKNFLKKVAIFVNGKKKIENGEAVISIPTSSFLTELTDYADNIFKVLRSEGAKVIKKGDSSYGKYLRAISEEN